MSHAAAFLRISLAGLLLALQPGAAFAATPAELLAAYVKQAGAPASVERGQRLFEKKFDNDFDWTCATCHTSNPLQAGTHAVTGKPIAPLAPAAQADRFSNLTQVEFHFRLNCRDVVGRECTAGEKADVLSWLISLKR